MKKILFAFGIMGLLTIAACDTPQPTTDPNNPGDTAVNTRTDTSTVNRPDSTQKP